VSFCRVIFLDMESSTYSAFSGDTHVFSGELRPLLIHLKELLEADPQRALIIFEDESGRQVEFDFQGTVDDVLAREAPPPRTGPGRPKLGVVSREISLLPRHWEWLERQPSGISAALRRLVEEAMKRDPGRQRAQQARAATGRVMTTLAGNRENFEEALRALYAGDGARFRQLVRSWPADIKKHLLRIGEPSFTEA
jgi:uncharacterized protein